METDAGLEFLHDKFSRSFLSFEEQINVGNAQFLSAARSLPRQNVGLEYSYDSASQYNLNYPQLHRPNQLQLNTSSQKTKVGGRVQNFCEAAQARRTFIGD